MTSQDKETGRVEVQVQALMSQVRSLNGKMPTRAEGNLAERPGPSRRRQSNREVDPQAQQLEVVDERFRHRNLKMRWCKKSARQPKERGKMGVQSKQGRQKTAADLELEP